MISVGSDAVGEGVREREEKRTPTDCSNDTTRTVSQCTHDKAVCYETTNEGSEKRG